MSEVLPFSETRKRRNSTESLHDLLIAAKNGNKTKTRLMNMGFFSWIRVDELLKVAEGSGLIMRTGKVWKTTEKGLEHAKAIYDLSRRLSQLQEE